jgi:predicted transcriptional regulator of viral defense system
MRPSEAAREIGVQPAQLHSLARRLEEQGEVERREGALYLASGSADAAAASEGAEPSATASQSEAV